MAETPLSSLETKLDRWSVSFQDEKLESAFRSYSRDLSTSTDQFVLISGTIIFLSYGFLDWLTLGETAKWAIIFRLVLVPSTISLIIWTFTDSGRRHIQIVSVIVVGGAAAAIGAMIFAVGSVSPPYYVGMLHVAIVFSSLSRINFPACAGLLIFTYTCFFLATLQFEPSSDLTAGHFFLALILISCAMLNYFLERNRRLEFLHHRDKERYYAQVQVMADEAARSSQRKNALLNVLGHVVKTPLHQIIGYAQIIEQAEDTDESVRDTKTFAEEIHRAGQSLSHQSQRILDYSRADAGLITSQPQKSNAARMVHEAIYRHQDTIDSKKISLAIDCCETPLFLDTRHVIRAIEELIDNAVRYSPPGSDLKVWTELIGQQVVLSIKDNGPGIPEGDIDRVGDALNKIDEFRNMGGDKLGIGVSLARILVRHGGGQLYYSSVPNHGTLARIAFPILAEDDAEKKSAA